MPRVTGGEAAIQSLLAHNVDTIFGLPGVQNDYFYTALYDQRDKFRVIHTRHEQATAYMALGYALTTDKPGVYSVVPGPGFLNTTAALATAYSRNARVFCLTGQIATDQIGRGFGMLHEIPDQLGMMRGLTKWAERANSPGEVPQLIAEAFRQMETGRPRPVALEIPPDVLSTQTEVNLDMPPQERLGPAVDDDAVAEAAKLLGNANFPMILVGGGALDATEEVKQLAEMLQAPVVETYNGRGILSSRHPLSLTFPAGHQLWSQVDVALAVGTRMQNPLMYWGTDDELKIVRVDIDPLEHNRHGKPDIGLVADSRDALRALIEAVGKENRTRTSREEEMLGLKAEWETMFEGVSPQYDYIKAIRAELPDDGYYVEEMTQVGYVSRMAMPVYHPKTYVATGYQGTLGWGFATALGVKVAHPDKPVLSVTGDGGFMFNVQELATAVQHKIATVTLLFNDGAYGNVRRMQRQLYDNRIIASELQNPDFVKLAESFGAQGLRAKSIEEVRSALRKGFESDVPTVIDVPVGEMPNAWALYARSRVR